MVSRTLEVSSAAQTAGSSSDIVSGPLSGEDCGDGSLSEIARRMINRRLMGTVDDAVLLG